MMGRQISRTAWNKADNLQVREMEKPSSIPETARPVVKSTRLNLTTWTACTDVYTSMPKGIKLIKLNLYDEDHARPRVRMPGRDLGAKTGRWGNSWPDRLKDPG